MLMKLFGESFREYWPELISIGVAAGRNSREFFKSMPDYIDFYEGDKRKALKVIRGIVNNENTAEVFIEFIQQKEFIEQNRDFVKTTLVKIATAS